MRLQSRVFAVILVMAFAVTGAWATQVSQTKTFSGVPDFEKTLTFGKVNLCPDCTVNWIKVILALNVNGGQYILDNDADSPASGSFNFGGKVQIIGSDVAMIDAVFNPVVGIVQAGHSGSFNLQANVGDGPGDYSPDPPDGMVYNGGVESDSKEGLINSAVFGQYLGVGTFDVKIQSTQWSTYSGASGIEYAVNPVSADGSLTFIMDYDCIPEPSSIMALFAGIGALGLIRRRKA